MQTFPLWASRITQNFPIRLKDLDTSCSRQRTLNVIFPPSRVTNQDLSVNTREHFWFQDVKVFLFPV